jgi:hypothetical protein
MLVIVFLSRGVSFTEEPRLGASTLTGRFLAMMLIYLFAGPPRRIPMPCDLVRVTTRHQDDAG